MVKIQPKIIQSFVLDTQKISGGGELRKFSVVGHRNAVFSMEAINTHGHYYDFSSQTFSASSYRLKNIAITSSKYINHIKFPKLPDSNADYYDIFLFAEPAYNTKHAEYVEKRYIDGSVDLNSSIGSRSLMLRKRIFQYADLTLTLSAVTPNSLTALGSWSLTNDTFTVSRDKSSTNVPFKIIITTANTRNLVIDRQPEVRDTVTYVTRTVGSAAVPIRGEDISSATYYKWPLDNITGLQEGMFLDPAGTNVTANSIIKSYQTTYDVTSLTEERTEAVRESRTREAEPSRAIPSIYEETRVEEGKESEERVPGSEVVKTYYDVYEHAIQPTGELVLDDGIVTSQAGNVVFSHQQADALKSDSLKFYGYGNRNIDSLTGYDVRFKNLKVELTEVTTTTTANTVGSASTSVEISSRNGIRDGVSAVTGIGIDTSSAIPTVSSGAGTVSGAGTIVLSAAQELESGITLTFKNASTIATITGEIDILKVGRANATIYFDVERFLTAT